VTFSVVHRQTVRASIVVFFLFALAPSVVGSADSSPTTVLDVLKRSQRVLWLGAHPDDETSAGGLLARAKDMAGTLIMATMTHGENNDKTWNGVRRGSEMGKAREALFARSAGIFQADAYEVGPFVNGPRSLEELDALPANAPFRDWPSTATSEDVIAKWNTEGDPVGYLVHLLRQHKPDVIVAMDHYCGVSGHDEHIAAAKLLLRALPAAADATAYPEAGEAWKVGHVIFAASVLKPLIACRYCKCEGEPLPEAVQEVFTLEPSRTHHLTYLGVQCLVGRSYQQGMEGKEWSEAKMRAGCEQAQAAAKRAYRPKVTGQPFFESFRLRTLN